MEKETNLDQSTAEPIVIFDIDGVIRDVGGSYRRALADTVEHYTGGAYRPSQEEIDALKSEGIWNNDWEASQELIYRYFEGVGKPRPTSSNPLSQFPISFTYEELVAFFQSRYRGPDPTHWTGYICQEPLLVQAAYFDQLTQARIPWGFFSGATTGSAKYVLEKRLGLQSPVLVAMEDSPGKPDPTGLLQAVFQLKSSGSMAPVIYVGDTVGDMYTVENARQQQPDRRWIGVGVLPPHVHQSSEKGYTYSKTLLASGAAVVLDKVEKLTPIEIQKLVAG